MSTHRTKKWDGLLRGPRASYKVAKFGAHGGLVGRVHQLERERRARHHLLAQRQDVSSHDAVEQRGLTRGLGADDDEARDLGLLDVAGRTGQLAREDAVQSRRHL